MRLTRIVGLVVSVLLVTAAAWAQAPVFTGPVIAYKDSRDVVLEWPPAVGADGYSVYRFESLPIPAPLPLPIGTVTGTLFRDGGAVDGPPYRYYYLVTAYNGFGETAAPNLAFKLNLEIPSYPDRMNNTFVSLPYLYFPRGAGEPATVDDLCDLGQGIAGVARADYDVCSIMFKACGSPFFHYDLQPGSGYIFIVSEATMLDIVGSHDPAYHAGEASEVPLRATSDCDCNFNVISVPYNTTARDAEDICQELGGGANEWITRYDTATDTNENHFCGSSRHNFSVEPGEAYILRTHASGWQPAVYR